MANKLQLKHNKNEDFNIENYTNVILAKSEPLYDTVHKKLYIVLRISHQVLYLI